MTLAIVVAGLCLATFLVVAGLVEHLVRRPRASLRAKFVILFVGLAVAEVLSLPVLAVAVVGEGLIGLYS